MALNGSPEFKNSNPKPRAAELFGTCGHRLSKLRRAQLCNPLYTKFQASEPSGFETEDFFFHIAYVFLCFKPRSPWRKAILDSQTLI